MGAIRGDGWRLGRTPAPWRWTRSWWRVAVLAPCCVDGWFASSAAPFTWKANVFAGVPIGVMALAEVARRRSLIGSWPPRRESRGSLGLWLVGFGAAAAWELANYFQQPRRLHPTISSLVGQLQAHRLGDAALFAFWLLAGCYLVTRWS